LGVALCPCDGTLTQDEYAPVVELVQEGISSRPELLLEPLAERMERLAAEQRFEEAAVVRGPPPGPGAGTGAPAGVAGAARSRDHRGAGCRRRARADPPGTPGPFVAGGQRASPPGGGHGRRGGHPGAARRTRRRGGPPVVALAVLGGRPPAPLRRAAPPPGPAGADAGGHGRVCLLTLLSMRFIVRPGADPVATADATLLKTLGLPYGG